MSYKGKRYYLNQLKDVYLFSKSILGAKCVTDHKFKKKVDGFDGYLRFDIEGESLEKDYLVKLNNEFDNYWNKYHYLKLESEFLLKDSRLDLSTHLFFVTLLLIAIFVNIFLITHSYFNNYLIIILGIALILIPSIVYLLRYLESINFLKMIDRHKEKLTDKLAFMNTKMLEILKKSPLYNNQILDNYLEDYTFDEEKNLLEKQIEEQIAEKE